MPDSEDVWPEDEYAPKKVVDASEIGPVVAKIQTFNKKTNWQTNAEIRLGSKAWRPAAVSESRDAILHICLTGEIPRYVATRMSEAFSVGIKTVVALKIDALYSSELLELLAAVDAEVLVLIDPLSKNLRPRHFMAAMADLNVPASPATRVKIGKVVFGRIKIGTKQEKGRRLEALLAFLFSQVADFRVVERNLRTATQEIDIVLQIDRYSQRAWQQNVPYLIVEAKNWSDRVPQHVVSSLMSKIQTKGKSCKMALLISTAGFTSDADKEELRYSLTENRIVMIGPEALKSLIGAKNLDSTLDKIVRDGRMR